MVQDLWASENYVPVARGGAVDDRGVGAAPRARRGETGEERILVSHTSTFRSR
jgi:hypothetical protein